jgi:protein-disulfide isomerase
MSRFHEEISTLVGKRRRNNRRDESWPSGGVTKPSLLLMTAMNWKPLAVRLVLAFALAMIMNPSPATTGRTAKAIVREPARLDFGTPSALPQLRIRDIMSTWRTSEALAAEDSPKPVNSGVNNAKLIAALQKRLLVPNLADLTLGPPSPSPLPGITQRTITVNGGVGERFQVELFTDASGDKGILAQRFAPFSMADPWERVDMKLLHLKDRPTLGPAGAPVNIVEFADFECPYCAKAFNEVETLVNTTYKGHVRLTWKAFPLQGHTWAEQAAIAAECVRQQNPQAFWSIAGDFYRDQNEITPQNLRDHIYSYASSLGIDTKALNACILGTQAEARIDQDKIDGAAVHVVSTPTFLINGVPVVGLPTSNVFDFVITSQMQAAHPHAS